MLIRRWKILCAALALLCLSSSAWAWPVADTLTWGAVPNAVSYKVEKTTDNGTTWAVIGSPSTPTLTYNGTETGLVLYRISACTAATGGGICTVRPEVGLWHNESWRPLSAPANLGTQ